MPQTQTDDTGSPNTPRLDGVHVRRGAYAFGWVGNVALQIWYVQATPAAALEFSNQARKGLTRFPQGASGIHWMFEGIDLPDSETRGHFSTLIRELGDRVGDVAIVLETSGFWASAIRAMMTGLRIAGGARANSVNFRVERTLSDVLDWLPERHQKRTGQRVTAAQIRQGFDELFAMSKAQ